MKLGVDMDDTVAFSNRKLIETALLFDENDIILLSPYRNADLVCAYNALGKAGQLHL